MKINFPNVRLSFPELFVAKPFKPGDEPKFKATFLVPKDSPLHKAIDEAIDKVGTEAFKDKWPSIKKSIVNNPNKYCFQDGDSKDYDGYAGMMAFSASNKARPLVIDGKKNPLTQADGKPYAGCFVNGLVEVFAYTNSGNGISASLKGVQFVRDGDAFAGGTPALPDDFDEITEGADADDIA